MSEKKSSNQESKVDLPGGEQKLRPFLNPHVLYGLLAFVILAALFVSLIHQQYRIIKQEQKKEGYGVAEDAKEKLLQALANSLSATKILSFFIDQDGMVKNFDSVAAQILSTNKGIDALELVPGGIIQYVYPLQGNENVLGYNILTDSTRNKEAYRAIEKNELFFSGPFNLKQGGFGIVGRLPVFRNGKFWGFSAVVIKMATLLKAVDIDSTGKKGYYFQLSKINPGTGKNEFFIPHKTRPSKDYATYVQLPIGDWKLSVESVGENKGLTGILFLVLIGFLFSVLGGIFVTTILRRPEKLDRLVKERTSALKGSEKKYRSVIERVSDAFVALDVNWVYTYVNEKAGEILGRKPESLVGENIWAEFPKALDQPFYHAHKRAMKMQEYQYLEEYNSYLNKWIENHIYPSKDGLTVFFKDVTDIKQITLALKNKEEKYRSLIEHASDGIVITDLEGIILEVNNSIKNIIGFSEEEMIGCHLAQYLPETDLVNTSLRINELMQGKSLLYERQLIKKDGTIIDVEINSKMASSHTLIGFIRDITERKKHENVLQYQARLLESVSDAITSLDINRCIVSWNKACEDLFGFTNHEVIGKRIPELITFEYPYTNNETVFEQVFTEGKWKGEFNFIHPKSGEKVHLLSCINLLKNKEGGISGFIITSNNITERKKADEILQQSEKKYKLLFYNNPLPMFMTTIPGLNIIDVNEAAIKQYGYTREEFLQMNSTDLRPDEDVQNFIKEVEKMEAGVINTRIWRQKKKDGTIIQVETYTHQIMYEGKKVWLGLSHDVTEKYEAKELLQKSYEDIRLLVSNLQTIREDERTTIAREIHDELGQQLTGLKLDLFWLMQKINSTDDEITGKMKKSVELINTTIGWVRKISTDLRPSILDDFGLLPALEWHGEEFEKRSGTKVIFTNSVGDIIVSPQVATGVFRIYQELFTNIARHANASLVKTSLTKDENRLYLSIKDDGVGFDPETIKNKRTLGLLGIKERVLLFGGTYEFKSKTGEGSVTTISIPLELVKTKI